MQELRTHEVSIDGITQRFYVAGDGPLCLVQPGGPGVEWTYLRMPLVEEHVTAVYLEPIATGESGRLPTHPHGYTVGNYVRAVRGVVQHLGESDVYLLGHSHGGFVAQQYALTYSGGLAGIVLYSTAPAVGAEFTARLQRNATAWGERFADRPEAAEVLRALAADEFADDEGATVHLRAIMPLYFTDYWAMEPQLKPVRDAIRMWYVDSDDEVFDVRDRLGSIGVPALAVTGRHDWICEPSWSVELAEGIPGGELLVLEDSGHFGHVEEPEEFADAIARFVKQ